MIDLTAAPLCHRRHRLATDIVIPNPELKHKKHVFFVFFMFELPMSTILVFGINISVTNQFDSFFPVFSVVSLRI